MTPKLFVLLIVFVLGSGAVSYAVVGPNLPTNDVEAQLALGEQEPTTEPISLKGPELAPVPRARCGVGSDPLRGIQGRVSAEAINSPGAVDGWTCNVQPVGQAPTPGGFRVWRYEDPQGNVCAYYDTSAAAPANLTSLAGGPTPGVVVLDMSDPGNPVETARLTTPGMLAPHESLNLSPRRGLLAAEVGNALTLPGTLDVYDVRTDCRHPKLLSLLPTVTGHESGFSPDGQTYWVAGGVGYIKAIDLSDPTDPREIWSGAYYSHGLNFSRDGETMYQTDPINGSVGVFDVSEIQDREPSPQAHERHRLTWDTVSIPQNTIPLEIDRKPYLLEFDEFAFRFNPATLADRVGAGRLINMTRPAKPRIASNLRLTVNMPAAHREYSSDPSPFGPANNALTYAAHYCAVPRQKDPGIVACSFLNSGLRIFDITKPRKPREVAYFIAPPNDGKVPGLLPGNLALSQPAFDPKHRDVWYTDAGSGFYSVHLGREVWPRNQPDEPGGSGENGAGDKGKGGTKDSGKAGGGDSDSGTPGGDGSGSSDDGSLNDDGSGSSITVATDTSPTPSSGASLPFTGLQLGAMLVIGLALLGAGLMLRRGSRLRN